MSGRTEGPLAVSMGEPAGIGPDVILQAYAGRASAPVPPFAVFGSAQFLQERAQRLGLSVAIETVTPDRVMQVFLSALPVIDLEGNCPDIPGVIQSQTAGIVVRAIGDAVAAIRSGAFRALSTAPIHKSALYEAGFTFPGHTEFLASLCADDGIVPHPVMMLAHEQYRVVPLTIHVPLAHVPALVTAELIERCVNIVDRDLRQRFGLTKPRIAVCGLNPHAGEDGTIGGEERDLIAPALQRLASDGFTVSGPHSADTLFHPPHWQQHDCVIAMYHDQALIPIKTLAFDKGVNVTLGLPIVRTSPDHGTALSLAGTGKASHASFLASLRLADKMSAVAAA